MELHLGYSKIKIMLNYSNKKKKFCSSYIQTGNFFFNAAAFKKNFSFMFFIISIIKTFKNE